MRRKRKDQMKRTFARAGVFVFFATVIIVSLVLIKKGDPDSVETVNTMPEEYHTQTDVISEPEETDARYGHDIEFEEYPEEETETEVLPEDDFYLHIVRHILGGTDSDAASTHNHYITHVGIILFPGYLTYIRNIFASSGEVNNII